MKHSYDSMFNLIKNGIGYTFTSLIYSPYIRLKHEKGS